MLCLSKTAQLASWLRACIERERQSRTEDHEVHIERPVSRPETPDRVERAISIAAKSAAKDLVEFGSES
jgi:hypothetical protein